MIGGGWFFIRKKLLVFVLILIFAALMSNSCAVTSSFSGTAGTSTAGFSTEMEAVLSQSVISSSALSLAGGLRLDRMIDGSGSLDEDHAVSNKEGSNARVKAIVDNAERYRYAYTLTPGEGSGYTAKEVSAKEQLTATNAEMISALAEAWNNEGDHSINEFSVTLGSVEGLSNFAKASKTRAYTTQSAISSNGQLIKINAAADNAMQTKIRSDVAVEGGEVGAFSSSHTSSLTTVSSDQSIKYASGSVITFNAGNSNKEGEETLFAGSFKDGSVQDYRSIGKATGTSTETTSSIRPKAVDRRFYSLAKNTRLADEGTASPVNYGAGEFIVIPIYGSTTKVQATANSMYVNLKPTLPAGSKTAIILEPFRVYALESGGTDFSGTAVPALVNSFYATTRYTDAGATKDKFYGLDKYNIALIKSHMNDGAIGTSTDPSTIYAAELRYAKPSSKSMIILAGCDSFGGYPEPSTLARAVRKADVRGGYEVSVYTAWNQDYMGKLFTLMAEGMTIGDANNYIWETYRYTWAAEKGIDPNDLYMAKLRLYGNEDFKIV